MNEKILEMFLNSEISIMPKTEEQSTEFLRFFQERGTKSLSGKNLIDLEWFKYEKDKCYFYRNEKMGVTFVDDSIRPVKTWDELMF